VNDETELSRETKNSRPNSKKRIEKTADAVYSTPIKILRFIKCVKCHVHEGIDSSVLFPWNRVEFAVAELKEMANGQVRPSYCRTITTFRFTG
jgi:hypothetical protein